MEIEEVVVDSPVAFFDCEEFLVDFPNMELIVQVANECQEDVCFMKAKMHRYPASIRALGINQRYTTPRVVAISPYSHGCEELKQAEKMKCLDAYRCIEIDSTHSMEDMYEAFVRVAPVAHRCYDEDVMAGIRDDDFALMMFLDACFLVQYIFIMGVSSGSGVLDESLCSFFDTNDYEIFQDIMLLENQIPWLVVETVMEFSHVSLANFICSLKGSLQEYRNVADEELFHIDGSYKPQHLLGLFRFYLVGRINKPPRAQDSVDDYTTTVSLTAHGLAEIGITLKANKHSELIRIGVKTKGPFFGELFMAPVGLNDARVTCLINMAALELCTTLNFRGQKDEDSAVCSYLHLLSMLVAKEEDVQELRKQRILQGAGLTNREVLDFFKELHGVRLGSGFVNTLVEIEHCKSKRWMWITLYEFYYGKQGNYCQSSFCHCKYCRYHSDDHWGHQESQDHR